MQAVHSNTRIALSNILVATDFSQASKLALPYAIALARQYDAKIVLGHAISPEPHLSVPLDPLPPEADAVRREAEGKLAEFARPELLGDTPYEEALARGEFWNVISGMIRKHGIDLIVAGTRGRQGLRKIVLGSHAETIFRRTDCPVLTIGPKVRPLEGGNWKLKHILFPTDGSEDSLAALPYALSLAEENEANLIFLQLIPFIAPEYRWNDDVSVREALRALVPAEAEAWCQPEFVVRFDFPAEGILQLAGERDADLIVMGVRKPAERAIAAHLPWPVASQVVAEAHCPVLTVRGQRGPC
ncbi:MAG: universal stress protein [Terriglobales bacterium]